MRLAFSVLISNLPCIALAVLALISLDHNHPWLSVGFLGIAVILAHTVPGENKNG